jgi:hypothetical protein
MGRTRFFGGKALVTSVRIGAFASLVNTDTITIGSKIYEWGAGTTGRVQVVIGGSGALCITALIAAINANKPSVPCTAVVDATDTSVCHVIADARGSAGNLVCASTMTGATNIISHTLGVGGENGGNQILHRGSYALVALDVTTTAFRVPTGLASPAHFMFQVRRAGVLIAVTDAVTVVGGDLVYTFAGATHAQAADVFAWMAWE